MKDQTKIPMYTSKAKQVAIKEFTRILAMDENDFLFNLCGLYGRVLQQSDKKTDKK
jgi:hypothetical protein